MKKLFLSVLCAAAAFAPAFAQEAAETITDGENGIVTIDDNFLAAFDNIVDSNKMTNTSTWSVQENAAVTYTAQAVTKVTNKETLAPSYIQILAFQGANLQFTLPDYNCTEFTIHSSGSPLNGEYEVYMNGELCEEASFKIESKDNYDIKVAIPEAYQAAGTVYKIVNKLGGISEGAAANYRLQMTGITYVCTPKEVEEVPAETITENADGTVTITNNFLAAFDNIVDNKYNATNPTTSTWSVQDNAAVNFTSQWMTKATDSEKNPAYIQILAYPGAYLQFTLPDYNCSEFILSSFSSIVDGVFEIYAGTSTENLAYLSEITITAANRNSDIKFEITDPVYQAAGTIYRIVNKLGGKNNGAANNYRLQLTGMSFVCTPYIQWEAPTCNIPNGSFLLEGQEIIFSCEEGGTISGQITYSIKDGDATVEQNVDIVDNKFIVPAGLNNGFVIKVNAQVTGGDRKDSEKANWRFIFTNGQNIILADKYFTGIDESQANKTSFGYKFSAVNFGVTNTTITIQVTVKDAEENVVKEYTKVFTPGEEPEAYAEVEEGEEGEEGVISPVIPRVFEGSIEAEDLDLGNYSATMGIKIGSAKNFQDMVDPTTGETTRTFTVRDTPLTGITTVDAPETEAPVYYNLNGLRVEPAKGMGLLIRVCGGKATKVVM